jgi:hypothetical protein
MAALLSTGTAAAQYAGDNKDESPSDAPAAEGTEAEGTEAEGTEAEEPMSELDKLKAMEADSETPTVVGARPVSAGSPAKVGEAGMGTEASERERARSSIGDVGQSVRQKGEDAVPLKFKFHGYYRTRYNWIGNAPMPVGSIPSASRFPSKNASFGEMRLRLDPEVTYGPNPDLPIARLRFTIDGLDNVVYGDNCRRPVQDRSQWLRSHRVAEARACLDRVLGPGGPNPRWPNGIALGHGPADARRQRPRRVG